jgi:hypothetical protein
LDILRIVLTAGDLEPVVLIVVGELGMGLEQWSDKTFKGDGAGLTKFLATRRSITCLTAFGLYAQKVAR